MARYAMPRGLVFILLGIVMFLMPETVMNVSVYIMAAYAIVLGLIKVAGYVKSKAYSGFGIDMISGVMLIVLGITILLGGFLMVINAFGAAVFFFQVFSVLIIIQGVAGMVSYFSFKKMGKDL